MENYEKYKELKKTQNEIVDNLSDKLNSFQRSSSGLISDEIRNSTEFKKIKNQYNIEFKVLQKLNQLGTKLYKKQIRDDYENSRKKR